MVNVNLIQVQLLVRLTWKQPLTVRHYHEDYMHKSNFEKKLVTPLQAFSVCTSIFLFVIN